MNQTEHIGEMIMALSEHQIAAPLYSQWSL